MRMSLSRIEIPTYSPIEMLVTEASQIRKTSSYLQQSTLVIAVMIH